MDSEPRTENGRHLCQRLEDTAKGGMTANDLRRILVSHFTKITAESQFLTQLYVNGATNETSDELTTEKPNRIRRREYIADAISQNRRIKGMIAALEASANDHVIVNMLADPFVMVPSGPTVSQEPSPAPADLTAERTELLLWVLHNPEVHQIKWKPKDLKKRGLTRGAKLLGDDVILYSYSSSSMGRFHRDSKAVELDFQPRWSRCLKNCDFFCVQTKSHSSYLIICAYHERIGEEKNLKMFNSDGRVLHAEKIESKVKAMKWKSTWLMVTWPSSHAAIWDVTETGGFKNRRNFVTECEWISSIEIQGDTLVTLSNAEPFDINCKSVIEVWNVAADTVQRRRALQGYEGLICMSYHSGVVIAGSKDRTLRAFDVNNGKCVKTLEGHVGSINACACNETYITSGDSKGMIKVWSRQSVMDPDKVDCHALLEDHRHKSAVLLMEIGQNFMITQDLDAKIFYWDFSQFQTRKSCYIV